MLLDSVATGRQRGGGQRGLLGGFGAQSTIDSGSINLFATEMPSSPKRDD
ncbi:hypothetical protein [Cystobacter ferrugineus]|nr:hypothetical protein [Cystobacter ferrugineus]